MKISVLVVGRVRGPLAPAVVEFETRAARYWKLEVVEVEAGTGRGSARDPQRVRGAEGRRLLARIPDDSEAWVLTREGACASSETLAKDLGERALRGSPDVTFVVGGAFGLDPEILNRGDRKLSLSEMTFPHGIARLLLAEQLYRAGTILRNEPYHKGSR